MNPDYTAIMLVIDRSGSMQAIRSETEATINAYIDGQKKESGKRTLRLVTFDNMYDLVHPSHPVDQVNKFRLEPRGLTALYDAIGRSIDEFGRELNAMDPDERPAHVVVGILTDGLENASQRYSQDQVRKMIEHQQDVYKWHFLFMAANQDAVLVGQDMGLAASSSLTFNTSKRGVDSLIGTMSTYTATASAGAVPVVMEKQRKEAMEE